MQTFHEGELSREVSSTWTAQIVNAPAGFLTLIPATAGTFQSFSLSANATGAPREALLRFSSTIEGTSVSTDITIRQLSTDIIVTTDPLLDTPLSSGAGSVDITYTYGGSATGASFSIVGDFITATGVAAITGNETVQTFTIAANGTNSERQGTIQFTATDGVNSVSEEVIVVQSGSGEAHTISVGTVCGRDEVVSGRRGRCIYGYFGRRGDGFYGYVGVLFYACGECGFDTGTYVCIGG